MLEAAGPEKVVACHNDQALCLTVMQVCSFRSSSCAGTWLIRFGPSVAWPAAVLQWQPAGSAVKPFLRQTPLTNLPGLAN